jgi:hypothetical protein
MRGPRIAQNEVDVWNRCASPRGTGSSARSDARRASGTAAAVLSGGTASDAATRGRAAGRGAQLCAAGSHRGDPAPRDPLPTERPLPVWREWPLLKPADDRRGTGSVRTERAQFRRPTRVVAADAVLPLSHGDAAA